MGNTDELRYDLYVAKKGWAGMDISQRQGLLKCLRADLAGQRNCLMELTRQQFFNRVFDQFFADFCESCEGEKYNYLLFLADASFFELVRECVGENSRDYCYLNERRFAAFFNTMPPGYKVLRTVVASLMMEFLSVRMQRAVFDMVQKEKKLMGYRYMVKGIFSGAVRYDDLVYETLSAEIASSDEERLKKASIDNPAYVVGILYARGYLDDYEMFRYRDHCVRSDIIFLCIYPEYFDMDHYRKEWKELTTQPRIAARLRKKRTELLI